METLEYKGILNAIKVIKENNEIYTVVYFKYTNGIFSTLINNETLKEIMDKYNIGISHKTIFMFTDYDRMFYFQDNMFHEDNEIHLLDVISEFEEKIKNYIKNLLKDVYFDEDGYLLIEENNFHASAIEKAPVNEFTKILDEDLNVDSYFIKALEKTAIVCLTDYLILNYSNDWSNEGMYGPQSYGGAIFLKDNELIDFDSYDCYDFNFTKLSNNILHDYGENLIWDENTIIEINNSDLRIYCLLKDISLFKGIIDNHIETGLCDDIKSLMEVKYTKHSDIQKSLVRDYKLISIQKLKKLFEKYEKQKKNLYNEYLESIKEQADFIIEQEEYDELPFM